MVADAVWVSSDAEDGAEPMTGSPNGGRATYALTAYVLECTTCPGGTDALLDPRVAALIAAGGLAVMTLLIVFAGYLRYRDREIPGWLIGATAFAYGVGASLTVVLWPDEESPLSSAILLGLALAPAILAARVRRFD